jgi:aspartate 1-decarboxylase
MRTLLNSKIHRATVTEANLDYEGSITIDSELMEAADLVPFEQVHVVDVNNGSRLVTYAIEGQAGSGVICLNGAAARLVNKGDIVIIMSYDLLTKEEEKTHEPKLVYVNDHNEVVRLGHSITAGTLSTWATE